MESFSIVTDTKLAYAAGIIDGEGSIGAYTRGSKQGRGSLCLQLTVANTDIRMLVFLSELWGGKVSTLNRKHMKRQLYEWSRVGRECGCVLQDVLPYLIVKKEQAELAVEFANSIQFGCGKGRSYILSDETIERRHEIALELKQLKVA